MKSKSKAIIKELRKYSDPERAVFEKKYQKSERKHFGISHKNIEKSLRSFVKEYSQADLLNCAQKLWQTDVFDDMVTATKILKHKKITKDKNLWSFCSHWIKDCDGWALADGLSMSLREVLVNDPSLLDELDLWKESEHLWTKRAVLVFTLPYATKKLPHKRMIAWAGEYATDGRWFIQKAIGWWMRTLSADSPGEVVEFVQKYWQDLKPVAKKESTRKLPEEWFKKITQ